MSHSQTKKITKFKSRHSEGHKKKPKIFKDKMWGVYSKWGMHQAFQYKADAEAFVEKFQSHNMDIYYSIIKGQFIYSFK